MFSLTLDKYLISFRYIPAGKIVDDIRGTVYLYRPFFLSTTPITELQWSRVFGDPISKGENYPKTNITFGEAVTFCSFLSKAIKQDVNLPTEHEWEYACQPDCPIGWHINNSDYKIHEVGKLQPNKFGLYDMLGNVWEWCESKEKVVKGGSAFSWRDHCYASFSVLQNPFERNSLTGIRIKLELV